MKKLKFHIILLTIFLLSIIDIIMKWFAFTYFPPDNSPGLSSFIDLVFHKNYGIAFNIPLPLFIVVPVTLIIISIISSSIVKSRFTQPNVTLGLTIILFGAINNLVDRIINGYTTDYLMLFKTSIINLADVLILFGVVIIMVYHNEGEKQLSN